MTDIILCGAGGRMGRAVSTAAAENPEKYNIVAGVDPFFGGQVSPFPVYAEISECTENADVIIDFSNHAGTLPMLDYPKEKKIPVVIATTGHTEEEFAAIEEASKEIAILKSGNMSLGVNLLTALTEKAASMLPGFDIEIIEAHHAKKLDAPSGTAMMIAQAAEKGRGGGEFIYDRHERRAERGKDEIGISSVRGGTIVGEHKVIFAGENEVLTISHSAQSREIFAAGALSAAGFLSGKQSGYYSMSDIFNL